MRPKLGLEFIKFLRNDSSYRELEHDIKYLPYQNLKDLNCFSLWFIYDEI
jgi:hypothetical protein